MQVRATAILTQTEDFRVGYETGLAGGMCIDGTQRFKLDQPVTEELIVEIIRYGMRSHERKELLQCTQVVLSSP